MNQYVTGAMIRRLRESNGMTQQQLAEKIHASDKTISKWETGRGYPDITLIEPLSRALGVSLIELFSGENVVNANRSFHMLRTKLYVCPICGNILHSTGEAIVSCCGITLPPLEAEDCDEAHRIRFEPIEDEYYVTVSHEMSKTHFITFFIAVRDDGYEFKSCTPKARPKPASRSGGPNTCTAAAISTAYSEPR